MAEGAQAAGVARAHFGSKHGARRARSHRSNLLLTVGAGLESWRGLRGRRWPRYLLQAWRRGRRAAPLDVLPYEKLLPLPLDAVRAALGIEPPERAHLGGIIKMPA